MLLTGRDGILRVFDSSAILLGTAPRDEATVDIVTWDGATTWANITTNVEADDTNYANNFLTDNNDAVFVGADVMFAMLRYLKDAASDYAVGSGALLIYYFDGTDFSNSITAFSDGTASGGDCFAQDGYIGFKIPNDWAIGANTVNAALDSDKYYVKLMLTSTSTPAPDADILCPCDGQFLEVAFSQMDFNGPGGRPLVEEKTILNRGRVDALAHNITGPDNLIYDFVPISWSCILDDTHNHHALEIALQCGNPGSARWTGAGVTTKGTTKNDGVNFNPGFEDTSKKTVNVQMLWDNSSGLTVGRAYYETHFPPSEQTYGEGDESNIINCNGGCYGVIERISGFGNRY